MSNSRHVKFFEECPTTKKDWEKPRQRIIWAKQFFIHRKQTAPQGKSFQMQKNDKDFR